MGLVANPNLDDGKGTKQRALNDLHINYENTLKEIYNIITQEDIDFEENPFFKAMKIPGQQAEESPDIDRTTENQEIDVDQQ